MSANATDVKSTIAMGIESPNEMFATRRMA